MPSDAFAERILRFIEAKDYRPRQVHELAEAMGVGEAEHGDFHEACKALMKTGRVVLGGRNALTLPDPPGKIVGTFRANDRGFGFVIPDNPNSHGDLYVPRGQTGDAITGDTVLARVQKRGKREGRMMYEGRVMEIVRRGQSRFVGELHNQFRRWFVLPDGNTLHVPILVGDPGAKNAKPGDQVVVEITQYPAPGVEARGVIAKVLGARGRPDVETAGIIEQYQLPGEFPEAVLADAHQSIERFDPKHLAKDREDLRKLTIITIDPVDARDFDDAISLTENKDGTVELGVHIADVSYFVCEGGALDSEARSRSNSVYLPRTVIPMLPEALSNGVCSLQEREPRLTKSAFITYDAQGRVLRSRLANTIIQSAKRLTYEQASAILEGKTGRMSAKVVSLIRAMEKLAKAIRARRLRAGMLELDLPEVELVHDDDGRVIDVVPADASFSHKIIEMFMVEANEAVARLLDSLNVPFLSRVHDRPRDLATGNLQKFLAALGHKLPGRADRMALQALLDQVRGRLDGFPVHLAVLRSMQQAEYAPLAIGHYALASEHYCHFTSPIRRYPDLTVHRLLDAYFAGRLTKSRIPDDVPTRAELTTLGKLCSANERRAEAAERELRLVLILRLLEQHIGEEFDGIATGVANVGVFVQLSRYLIDGLLTFDNLPDDWWEVDPARGCVMGQRSGYRIAIGDRLKVRIARILIPTRRMEVALAKPLEKAKRGATAGMEVGAPSPRERRGGRKSGVRVVRASGESAHRAKRGTGRSIQERTARKQRRKKR